MGLFGFVKKAIGKVAKAGLSSVTGGVSDMLLSNLKQKGQQKQAAKAAAAKIATNQNLAQMYKVTPSVVSPQAQMEKMGIGIRVGGAKPKAKKRRAPVARAKTSTKRTTRTSSGKKRVPPKGGLDFAAMGREYRAAGSPGGDWRGWQRAHPIRNK